ncbi:phage tail protein [Gluconobacter potus]|uniref:Phage tail protein n=1 Tax=Gluconobacter potus TaxID=2724927 RepID=A0A149QPJ0_9PROT|nr:phage tail protein [Gluconobacter potus]KXU99234.1 phage tail protein [Gluconobacter potus]
MPRIYQYGDLNTTALTVPDLYVQVQQSTTVTISGVSTSRIGIVGTAGWGPINSPQILGGIADYLTTFGPKQAKATDAGVAVNISQLQGASDFRVVRVTDGTDVAATGTLNGVTITGLYTGTSGNAITATMAASGSGWMLTLTHAYLGTWAYTGATWSAIAALVAADSTAIVSITVPDSGTSLAAATVTLSGGTDGGTPTTAEFIGSDATPHTGMYALLGQGCALGLIHGLTDQTSWTTQATFGLGEGVYMIVTGPSGDTIANAVSVKAAAGLDSYGVSVMFGDWIYYTDDTLGTLLTSPQAWKAGRLASLSPQLPALNQQLYSITGSQKAGLASTSSKTYSSAELSALFEVDIDVICNPAPGGSYWAVRAGINSSDSATDGGDEYTRITNYLANSFVNAMGAYVGQAINSDLFQDVRASILDFLSDCAGQGILDGTTTTLPYGVTCDSTNNPQSRTSKGYVQADVQVQYQGIVRYFIVNLQGGAGVTVTVSNT